MATRDQARDHGRDRDPVPLSQRLLLRPEEVAAILGLGRSTIYELLRSGELSAVHIGRATRIPARDLERWIEQHSSSSANGANGANGAHGTHSANGAGAASDGRHRAL